MKNLTKEQIEIIKEQIEESVSYGNMYPNVARTLVDMLNEAINYSQCCKSDSELLPKQLSNEAYKCARTMDYKGFVNWWDKQV